MLAVGGRDGVGSWFEAEVDEEEEAIGRDGLMKAGEVEGAPVRDMEMANWSSSSSVIVEGSRAVRLSMSGEGSVPGRCDCINWKNHLRYLQSSKER